MIMNTKECKLACNDLGIPVFGKFKDRRPCFQGGNGMCMQNSGYGPKSKMLCTKKDTAEGNLLCHNVGYNICKSERKTQSRVLFFHFFAEDKFFLSQISCPDKTAIMGKTECANACKDLGIPVWYKAMDDGFPCYISGRGRCRQNGKHGARALKVCQHKTI